MAHVYRNPDEQVLAAFDHEESIDGPWWKLVKADIDALKPLWNDYYDWKWEEHIKALEKRAEITGRRIKPSERVQPPTPPYSWAAMKEMMINREIKSYLKYYRLVNTPKKPDIEEEVSQEIETFDE